MTIVSSTHFIGAVPFMEISPGVKTDANVGTGASGGANAGAAILNALRVGMIPLPPQTAGYTTAAAAAATAVASVSDAPTKAALTSVLATIAALMSA
jgi:hypothetical protein